MPDFFVVSADKRAASAFLLEKSGLYSLNATG
jgi:hypothetical protein